MLRRWRLAGAIENRPEVSGLNLGERKGEPKRGTAVVLGRLGARRVPSPVAVTLTSSTPLDSDFERHHRDLEDQGVAVVEPKIHFAVFSFSWWHGGHKARSPSSR